MVLELIDLSQDCQEQFSIKISEFARFSDAFMDSAAPHD